MILRAILFTAVLLLGVSARAQDPWPSESGGSAFNQPQDGDGDGAYDYIIVGDYDRDGITEMSDIQEAYNQLTDTGPRQVEILPGEYAPTLHADNTVGLLEILNQENVSIVCRAGAILQGRNTDDADVNMNIIYTDEAHGFTVKYCEFDGRTSTSYSNTGDVNPFRMALNLNHTNAARVEGNYIHDVYAQGLYVNGSENFVVTGNFFENIGGFYETGGPTSPGQPAIYIYTDASNFPSRHGIVSNNMIRRVVQGIAIRKASTNEVIESIYATGNKINNAIAACFQVGGVNQSYITDNDCFNSRQGFTMLNNTGYWPDGDEDATRSLTFSGNNIAGIFFPAENAIGIEAYQWGMVVKDNVVNGAQGIGLRVESPQRGLVVDGMVIKNVTTNGIQEANVGGVFGANQQEEVVYKNIIIENVDGDDAENTNYLGSFTTVTVPACTRERWARTVTITNASSSSDCTGGGGTTDNVCWCIPNTWTDYSFNSNTAPDGNGMVLLGGTNHRVENVRITGFSGDGIELSSTTDWSGSVFRDIYIDGREWGYLGEFATGSLPTCSGIRNGQWAYDTTTNSRKRCLNETWAAITGQTATRHGISLTALTGVGPTFENIHCSNINATTAGSCINIPASTTATNGILRNVTARCETTGQEEVDTPAIEMDYVVNIVATGLGNGWLADGLRSDNCENVPTINNAGANQAGMVADYVTTGAATGELCDHASEVGSIWRRTDAGAATVDLEYCEDTSAPAWQAK